MSAGASTGLAEGHELVQLTAKDFKGKVEPDWCPGCGDFGVLRSLQAVCAEMGRQPHQVVTISGIGCSSNFPGYFNAYGMHTLHGRALAVATGVQMANHELTVVCTAKSPPEVAPANVLPGPPTSCDVPEVSTTNTPPLPPLRV